VIQTSWFRHGSAKASTAALLGGTPRGGARLPADYVSRRCGYGRAQPLAALAGVVDRLALVYHHRARPRTAAFCGPLGMCLRATEVSLVPF